MVVIPAGVRLVKVRVKVRGARSQPEFAAQLGVHKNTYARWEHEEVPVSSDALAVMISEGWNANWVLAGAGPERLDQLRVVETRTQYQSHVLRADLLAMAVELIDSELERAKKAVATTARRGLRPDL